ncbi:hypothetical protein ACFL2R_02020 [Patescibacteria group bacterium]
MTISPEDFQGISSEEILRLRPSDCRRPLSVHEIEMIFKACDAFWMHPTQKNPMAPHVILTTEKHSNIYVNCPQVLQRTNLCQIMAWQMVLLLRRYYTGPVDWVVGSDSSALGLSKDIANILNARWHPLQKGPNKSQVWEKAIIQEGEFVLHIEELMTSGLTTQEVRKGIQKGNPYEVNFVPIIPLLVYRPDQGAPKTIDGSNLIHILSYDTYVVDPSKEECELCKNGSQPLKAKEYWNTLTSTM